MPFPSARDDDRNYGGRSQRYNMYNQPPEENYARSTKRPSTPPPGVPYTNPNVARYREHVEQHINRSVSQTLSNLKHSADTSVFSYVNHSGWGSQNLGKKRGGGGKYFIFYKVFIDLWVI